MKSDKEKRMDEIEGLVHKVVYGDPLLSMAAEEMQASIRHFASLYVNSKDPQELALLLILILGMLGVTEDVYNEAIKRL